MSHRRACRAALLVLVAGACAPPPAPPPPLAPAPTPAPTPERFHLGTHSRKVSTASAEAQAAFDRGLTLAFAFNHGAAERAFRAAAAADPKLAMAWWGVALVNGPHINNAAVTPEQARVAWEALGKARELAPGASDRERELIEALGQRYSFPQPEDRRPLDEAYARAVCELARSPGEDADLVTLCAEARMDLHPWDLWQQDGTPQAWTGEILDGLERAMELDPGHPGANHLYIHAVEASRTPGRATAAADRLGALAPGAGHLVHMPAHIYARTGRWADAAAANEAAIAADAHFREGTPDPGFFHIYMAHNHHFLSFVGMMQGRGGKALAAAREMVAGVPESFVKEAAFFADGLMAIPYEVLVRFGRWQEVLEEPEPADYLPISRALRLFSRAAALTALDRLEEAERERTAFHAAMKLVPEAGIVGNNPASEILAIAAAVLDGEMAARRGKLEAAVKSLRAAVKREDALRYDEPPDWVQPVRHTLGAVLLRAGKHAEAEAVYREDLDRWPENGWSLFGVARALRLQKKDAEAAAVEARFASAWSGADTRLTATCLCQPGT